MINTPTTLEEALDEIEILNNRIMLLGMKNTKLCLELDSLKKSLAESVRQFNNVESN